MKRPSWDEYFIEIAKQVASRATCPRLSVGAGIKQFVYSKAYDTPQGLKLFLEAGVTVIGIP